MNGPNANNIFKFLRYNSELYIPELGVCGHIEKNFEKFLIDKNGTSVQHISANMNPRNLINDFYIRLKA